MTLNDSLNAFMFPYSLMTLAIHVHFKLLTNALKFYAAVQVVFVFCGSKILYTALRRFCQEQ